MPPINFNPVTAQDLDHKQDPSLGNLNRVLKEMADNINILMGVHGPIPLMSDLDMQGKRIMNVGPAQETTDALSQVAADPMYSTEVQMQSMEAVGETMLQTTRRLNDGSQQHLISSDLIQQGTIPPVVTQAITYTATATVVTWHWTNLVVQYGDASQKMVQVPDGSLAVSGLTTGVPYFFYPYYDTKMGTVVFAVVPGGIGTPPCGYTAASGTAAQAQNTDGHVPLSNGGLQATPAGGGSGGGGGSNCIRFGAVVESKDRGIITIETVHPGEYIRSRTGWTKVVRKFISAEKHFIKVQLSNGESPQFTPSDPVPLWDGGELKACELSLASLLVGVVNKDEVPLQIEELTHVRGAGFVVLLSCVPDHEFLVGSHYPSMVAHNYIVPK